jgi:hypothetical protein
VADRRKPETRIVLETPSGRKVAELFPAELFAKKCPGNHRGRYRVRVNRKWVMPGAQNYAFLTLQEAFSALVGMVDGLEDTPEPNLPFGSYVRVPSSYLAGQAQYTRTYTKSKPFQGVDGRWQVLCAFFSEPVLVEDILAVEVMKGLGVAGEAKG